MIKLRHPDCIGVLGYSPAQKYIPFFSLEALLTYFLSEKAIGKLSEPRLWNSIRKFL